MRYSTFVAFIASTIVFALLIPHHPLFILLTSIGAAGTGIGIYNLVQTRHSILRNYPLIGLMRFFLESIRKEMRQYFIESDTDGTPFSRNKRAIVYQRAKVQLSINVLSVRFWMFINRALNGSPIRLRRNIPIQKLFVSPSADLNAQSLTRLLCLTSRR